MAGSIGGNRPGVPTLRVRILGPLRVEGVDSSGLGSRKQRSLLRALALAGGAPVSVDRLGEYLWPGPLPARPADQVGVLVSRLRAALGSERVARNDAGYALLADWVDVVALEELAAEAERRLKDGQAAAAATAAGAGLALATGPLLADEPDAAWAEEARQHVGRTLARLRLVRAEASLGTGDPFAAAGAAQAVLSEDPYDEHALRLLMTAHARAGRPAAALAAYAKTRSALAEELGTSPSELTERLHLAILREEVEPQAAVVMVPGTPHTRLMGREKEWDALDQALAAARHGARLVVVEGEAGIGKTRLLEDWSRSVGSDVAVLWGRCDPVGGLPLQPVLDALAGHLERAPEADADGLVAAAGPLLGPLLRKGEPAGASDPLTAQAVLFAGALDACCQAAGDSPCVLIIDDVHLADSATVGWLSFVARRSNAGPLLVVLARRPEGRFPVPMAKTLELGPLDLRAAAGIVGPERAAELLARSGGNPLFLVELRNHERGQLPVSIVESVGARCTQAGAAGQTLRAAAVLGGEVDLDLLSAVLQRSATALLEDLEVGQRLMVLEERGTAFRFRHELVRDALVAGTGASRRALVHREAARALEGRPDHDQLTVAYHARQGGDLRLAAKALAEAAALTSARYDHAEAERLLDESLDMHPSAASYLARGRVRLARDNFAGAEEDARRALGHGGGAAALELGSWAAYYQRDFAAARALCRNALMSLTETDGALRQSVSALTGRIAHADGDLSGADHALLQAVGPPGTSHAPVAAVWLGWLLADRGDPEGAEALAEQAGNDSALLAHPFAAAHRSLLAGYCAGLRGDTVRAMSLLDVVDGEIEVRHLEHFAGRTANYRAWLVRNLLSYNEADELNRAAAELSSARGLREPQAQAALDLADSHLRKGELDDASLQLRRSAAFGEGYAFAWKAAIRHRLLHARLALASGRAEEAETVATGLITEASKVGLSRYAALARATSLRARCSKGGPIDLRSASRTASEVARFAAPEAWWVIAELARDLDAQPLWELAEQRAVATAKGAGERSGSFLRQARTWLDKTSTSRSRR